MQLRPIVIVNEIRDFHIHSHLADGRKRPVTSLMFDLVFGER